MGLFCSLVFLGDFGAGGWVEVEVNWVSVLSSSSSLSLRSCRFVDDFEAGFTDERDDEVVSGDLVFGAEGKRSSQSDVSTLLMTRALAFGLVLSFDDGIVVFEKACGFSLLGARDTGSPNGSSSSPRSGLVAVGRDWVIMSTMLAFIVVVPTRTDEEPVNPARAKLGLGLNEVVVPGWSSPESDDASETPLRSNLSSSASSSLSRPSLLTSRERAVGALLVLDATGFSFPVLDLVRVGAGIVFARFIPFAAFLDLFVLSPSSNTSTRSFSTAMSIEAGTHIR